VSYSCPRPRRRNGILVVQSDLLISVSSDELAPGQLWQKLYDAFHKGNILMTIGTGRLTVREEEGLGLAGQHDYAILDLYQSDDQRLFLIKNPWTNGTVWKGSIPGTTLRENAENPGGKLTNAIKGSLPDDRKLSAGSFWMDFNSVLQSFETLYINWNPALFGHREDIHFGWDLSTHGESPGCFGENPQCAISCESGGEVWLLLSRHFQSGESSPTAASTTEDSATHSTSGYISLYVFDNNGQRVLLSDGALHRGPYVDSPQTLMQLDIPAKTTHTVVVSQQFLRPLQYRFTLTAYSKEPVSLIQAADKYPFFSLHHSAWIFANAGGNAGYASYPKNPQFGIRVPAPAHLALLIETEVPELSVHVKLVWANGQRATHITNRDIVGGSGEYRQQSALAEIPRVEAGQYTIICSTFEPWQLGQFTLRVSSTISCSVWPLPAEDAGKLSLRLPKVSFPAGIHRQAASLVLRRLTKLKIIGRYPDSKLVPKSPFRSPLRLAVESGRQQITAVFAESNNGTFRDAFTGVRTPEVDLDPQAAGKHGHLWIVLERQVAVNDKDGKAEEVDVEVLSDHAVEVGPWQIINS
jgi:calpain-7